MEKIKLKDINFFLLRKSKMQGSRSCVYFYKDKCIKIFDEQSLSSSKSILKLYESLDGYYNYNVLLPQTLIMDGDQLVGHITRRIKGKRVIDVFETEKQDLNYQQFFAIVKEISKILKELHNDDIIVSDLDFENILVTKDNEVFFCDTDSYNYGNISNLIISGILWQFMYDYRNECVSISKNSDRLSLLLAFMQTMYFLIPQRINYNYYKKYEVDIKTLQNLRNLFYELLNTDIKIRTIDYLDRFIDDTDSGIISRNEQMKYIRKHIG